MYGGGGERGRGDNYTNQTLQLKNNNSSQTQIQIN